MSSIGIPSDRPQTYDNVLNLKEKRSRSPGPERAEGVPLHRRPANPPLALHLCYIDNRAERAARIETAMGQHGHTVTTCLRADEALKTLSSSTIDAIILGPSGALSTILLTAIRRAAKSNINALPVVVLSTNETFDTDCDLMNYGANLVLPTTITAQQLNTRLRQLFFVDDDSDISSEQRQKICMLENSTILDSRLRLAIASTNSLVDTYFSVTDIIHLRVTSSPY
jgi:PleD family two-component response regulator